VSFWEANRRLLAGCGVALLAAAVVHMVVAGPRWSQARGIDQNNAKLMKEITTLSRETTRVSKALVALQEERGKLGAVLENIGGVMLEIPPESRFRVPRGEIDPRLYFQKKLNEMREERTAGRPYPVEAPLGFTKDLQNREDPGLLLERLAAVERLTDALHASRLPRVGRIRHEAVVTRGAKGVDDVHLAMLPMQVQVSADERSLVAFLSEVSEEGRFLALEDLTIEVTDPKARTFNVSARVSAVLLRKSKAPSRREPARGTRPLPVGRY
jgi:hypothetical protein